MKLLAVMGMAVVCHRLVRDLPQAQNAKLCEKPRQMEGFKTCADVEKAEAEGAFVLYSTDPEQGQVKLVGRLQQGSSPRSRPATSACRPARSTPRCCRSARPSPTWSTSSRSPTWA